MHDYYEQYPNRWLDLHNHINQNCGQGFLLQSDLRDRLSNQRDPTRLDAKNNPVPRQILEERNYQLARQARLAIDPMQEHINQVEEAFWLIQEERERGNVEDSDKELEPLCPHISSTPFPHGFKIPHAALYDSTIDSEAISVPLTL